MTARASMRPAPTPGGLPRSTEFGLVVHVMNGPIGAASAMKMSYAGITKGFTALGCMMMLAATRGGVAEGLRAELERSQPALLPWLQRQIPAMYSKAYRFVGEMEEISDYVGEDVSAQEMFDAFADFYTRLAADYRRQAGRGRRAGRVPQAEAVASGMRTQVGIVGAGPAGLFLSLLLQRAGVDCVVLESRSRDYVESRVRAGVLEQGTVDLMDELGAGERLHREGMPDPRLDIRFSGGIIHIDLPVLTPGKIVTVYGQQEVVKDLIAARLNRAAADPVRGRGDAHRRPRRQAADDPLQARGQRRDAGMRHRRRLRRLPRHLPRRHPGTSAHGLRPRFIRSAGSAFSPKRSRSRR